VIRRPRPVEPVAAWASQRISAAPEIGASGASSRSVFPPVAQPSGAHLLLGPMVPSTASRRVPASGSTRHILTGGSTTLATVPTDPCCGSALAEDHPGGHRVVGGFVDEDEAAGVPVSAVLVEEQ